MPLDSAALLGVVVILGQALSKLVEHKLREKKSGGDDRGHIVDSIKEEGDKTRTLLHDCVNELRNLRADIGRQDVDLRAVQSSVVRIQENQAVLMTLLNKNSNGSAA